MPSTREMPGSKTSACFERQSFLPPKSPGPTTHPSYLDYNSSQCLGSIGIPRPREGYRHQRTSSESTLIDEQPSWLDDLLKEPETPVRKGAHRRSSSDSFAYVDASNLSSNLDNLVYESLNHQRLAPEPSWAPEDLDHLKGLQHPHYIEANSFRWPQNRRKKSSLNTVNYVDSGHPSAKNMIIMNQGPISMNPGPISTTKEPEALTSAEQDQEESAQDVKGSLEKRDDSHVKQAQSQMETKRVKQQFAQRSRVRKLQYIAEMERNVQALQAEGFSISAEIEFLSQQNLILSLENKALKQRFESLSQEHLIKCFEQEMFEREIARLRALFHNQQQQLQLQQPQKQLQHQRQQQNPTSNHHRCSSKDLDLQFSKLSLKHKDANSARDPVTGPLHS